MAVSNIGLNGSLYMGAQALGANQIAIQTTGNNIANINTPGYVRQRANFATEVQANSTGEIDDGTQVSDIENLTSSLLNSLVQQSLGSQGYADNQASMTSTVQDALGEQFTSNSSSSTSSTTQAGEGAIQNALTTFFTDFQNLANNPTSTSARQVLVQDAQTLATSINGAYQRLQSTQSQIAGDASNVTTQINSLSTKIASLNQQIIAVQASGTNANDLEDARESDIESLSSLVNVTATTQSDGTVTVALADNSSVVLVDGSDSNGQGTTQSLSASYSATGNPPLTISASTTGTLGAGVPSSGSLGSDLDVANNVIGSPAANGNTGLLGQLDGVASALISAVNSQNEAGYDLNGNQGGAFFSGTGAANIAVSSGVAGNPSTIAASSTAGNTLDGSNALAIANLETNNSSILPAFQNMVSNLGETVSTAASSQTTQDQITQQVQDQRNSVSGVSIDEEMTNLINFQQSYAASARFLSTISSLYDTLLSMAPPS
ncbi:MAG TPA: flagellar hook-associated protein FlgK [Candidatus Methylacidiphilales bacterium]|jgi:flagellar hook-associated protein 1 FlgK|nr:flagellar hook-associated protein FlgK [Candidatus Methylacidiphilales bacterium]